MTITDVDSTTLDTATEPKAEDEVSAITVVPVPVGHRHHVDPSDLLQYAAPALFVLLGVWFAVLSVQKIEALASWGDVYAGSGHVTVEGCEARSQWGPDVWHCRARFAAGDAPGTIAPTTLVVSKGALVSDRPYVGEKVQVYHEIPDGIVLDGWGPDLTYSEATQLTELTRLYFSVLPRLLITLGALAWLLGWLATGRSRRSRAASSWERIPFRFSLQRRGLAWIALGLATGLFNIVLVQQVLGSVGTA